MDDAALILGALESFAAEFHVALPGRIKSYDASKQRAEIELQTRRPVSDGNGGFVHEVLAVLPNVPIMFNSGGGYFQSFPMQKGDPVEVVFQDVPIGAWLQKGQPTESGDVRLHHIGNAVAYPGGPRPGKEALHDADGSLMRMGKDQDGSAQIEFAAGEVRAGAGADKFVALAQKVLDELNTIASKFNAHTHSVSGTANTTTGAFSTSAAAPAPAQQYNASPVASSNLKAKP
jgi:hypothetical protein